MQFGISKEDLISVVSAYQQRSYCEDVDHLQQKEGDVAWIIRSLATHEKNGISAAEPDLIARKNKFGSNQKEAKLPPGFCSLLWEALDDFTLRILLVAALVSIGLEVGVAEESQRKKAWIEGFAILVAVFVSAFVTSINNYQKERQFITLNSVADSKKKVTVWRDGTPIEIHQDFVLVGDVVAINEGMEIPADGLLLNANDVTTDESAMTGEIDPIHKNILAACIKRKNQLLHNGEQNQQDKHQVPSPILMSGTRVLAGQGRMLVIVVGDQSCIGKIRALLQKDEEDSSTPLQHKLETLATRIGKFGLISAVFIVIVLIIRFVIMKEINNLSWSGKDAVRILDFFIIGVTVIVVAIPEGLPLSVTLSLAFSVKRMLEDQNLVRRMQACETMGGANNICSDKTGTLTMNKMVLTQIWNKSTKKVDTYSQKLSIDSLSKNQQYNQLFQIASLVNSTALLKPEQKGSSTQIALLKYFSKMGIDYQILRQKFQTKSKYPFSSARKRMSVIINYNGEDYLFIKGASQYILTSSNTWLNNETNKVEDITQTIQSQILQAIEEMAKSSLRTLCLGYKKLGKDFQGSGKDNKGVYDIEKSGITLLSVIGVRDNPRKQVPDAIKKCHTAGITVRMVTGDNIVTAKAIARQIGLLKQQDALALQGPDFNQRVGGIVCKKCKIPICDCPTTNKQAEQLKKQIRVDTVANGEQFDKIIDKLYVLARSRPQDKYCLVTGLKQRGNVVAVTGDGTNDAPALKKADVGFAMGIAGTEVAREAASIILIDDNFNSIVKAVLWGRNIYDSIRKFIQFQLTVNVVAVVITLIGSALIQKEVLKPIQMLWVNLIMDTLASLALATQNPNQNLLLRKPHSREDSMISKLMFKHIIGQAIFQIIVLMILIFNGENFIPQYTDSLDSEPLYMKNPDYKWHNGIIGGTVRSGRFHQINGDDDYQSVFDATQVYSRHFTFIFNAFVMMQVFNFINARKIHEEFNIFSGMSDHFLFPIIVVSIFALQILLVTFAGNAFGVYSNYGLSVQQWLISMGFGSLSLVVSVILKLLPFGKQKNLQQVQPVRTQPPNTDDNSFNKVMELKLTDNKEYFQLKREESSIGSGDSLSFFYYACPKAEDYYNLNSEAFRMFKCTPGKRFSSMREFHILQAGKVGCGSFGTVKLARHRTTCRTYAVKIIDLDQMPSESEVKLVEREIKLHSELDHPHIIKLWDTLREGRRIYMIMDYADGGNLFSHQNSKQNFSQPQAFKFFAQTLEGLRYLHSQNIIHRDLKPENLLLDSYSNIKICDFGWCAEDINAKRTTFCGTYEYMAPEMLFKAEYDYKVDIWALGVLLYEMLHGFAPFKGKCAAEVQQAMLRGEYDLAPHLSSQVRALIGSILQFQAEKRPSLQQILRHRWVVQMSGHINSYLQSDQIMLPRDVQSRIGLIPPPQMSLKATPKHRKNNSLNFDDNRNININLQINNYAFVPKNRPKNNYHSQQKDSNLQDFSAYKQAFDAFNKTSIKKSKMQPVCKTQISQLDVYKVLQKTKSSKQFKVKETSQLKKDDSRKKIKLRKSQMQIVQKMPVRFNTEAFDKDQWQPKIKKGNIKNRNVLTTKSTLKLQHKKD